MPRSRFQPHEPGSGVLSIFGFEAALPAAWASPKAKAGGDLVPVTVSAANYSQLTDEELYESVVNPGQAKPHLPPSPTSDQPLYYLAVPGEVYTSDINADAVYRELEIALERRNYFNVIYQEKAGHKPPRIDYLLRVHYGVRPWLIPSVRADRITWGNDGIVANKYKMGLAFDPIYDSREGTSQEEAAQLRFLSLAIRTSGAGRGAAPDPMDQHAAQSGLDDGTRVSHPFCLIVIEAFKFDAVKAQDKKARCVWTTFVAVPVDYGEKFSSLLHTMLQTATPYFGGTTDGVQEFDVPPGKVLMGEPVEVPASR